MTSTLGRTIWDQLDAATCGRTPFTLAHVGTIGHQGPEVRAMILRAVSAPDVFLATDRRTAKVDQLRHDPRIAVTCWDEGAHVQLRLRGVAELVEDPVTLARTWESFRPGTRDLFTAPPTPGTSLADAPARDDAEPFERFGWLRVRVAEIDHLDLSGPTHRRHVLRRADEWAAVPVVP